MILILGGTTEASELARLLADRPERACMLSLAGRTRNPALPPIPSRVGGFGGPAGLAAFLDEAGVTALIDATHPFARQISANAAAAAHATGTPLLVLRRRPWAAQPGDRWTVVEDAGAAAAALGEAPRRVLLTVGRLEMDRFLAAPQHHYLVRSVDPPEALPPQARLILARGPFDEAAERRLLAEERIEVVVTKNSGGTATHGKIAAARALGLPVILVAPPGPPEGARVETAEEALGWIERQDHETVSGEERGV
jgi:precorrin-6A/cobalt-precorrin-6A reductase